MSRTSLLALPSQCRAALDLGSPRSSVSPRVEQSLVDSLLNARYHLMEAESLFESSIINALKAPKERPNDVLGPSREFYEKHDLTFINNLMGLSCLFFLVSPLVVATEF